MIAKCYIMFYYYEKEGEILASDRGDLPWPKAEPAPGAPIWYLIEGDPVLGRGSFRVSHPGQLKAPHGLEVLDASRLPDVPLDATLSAALEAGRLTASARGCRRKGSPIAAGSQLLVWSDVVLHEYRGRWTVQEAAVDREFRGMREDLEKFSLGCYFAEVTELLVVEGLPCPELLSLLLNSLHALDRLDRPLGLVKAAFELRAMCLAGYEPLLDACAVCGCPTPEEPRFHLREGVLHCVGCRGSVGEGISLPLSSGSLAAMRHIVYGDPKRLFSFHLDGAGLETLAGVAEAYLLTQLERGFRTLDFYKGVCAMPSK